ncbi:MAG: sulfatase-like hydrolase/transferase, partial [Prolixibacteraceae bacterium]|nr:sulfatase-like hydrolase/transferase [Prolixibacteraceae bacterium]
TFVFLVFVMATFSCHSQVLKQEEKSPNIIFILVDDLRWDAMGFTGVYPFLKTPNIDKLRNEGVHFQNTFCTQSLCAPSRATILTGMFPQTNGVSTNQEGREFNPEKTPSFAQILQKDGYKTGFIGKWHMAENNRPRKGFDYWCSFAGQGHYNGNILNINGTEIRNDGYITDELNKYALDFIDRNADKPFCLYLSHKAVHQPFIPPERDKNLYSNDLVREPAGWSDNMESKPAWQRIQPTIDQRHRLRDKDMNKIQPVAIRHFGPWPAKTGKGKQKDYLRCLSAVDEGLGEIYELLQKKGILNNTVIMFAGDNGYFHGEHGKGDKRLAYNESMRIPLVMRYPKLAKPCSTVSDIVLNADIAPTFLEIAGAKIPAQIQGKSLVPLLKGENEDWRKSFLFTYWPDLIYFIPRITAVRTEKYLYSKTPDINDIDELYDEQNDPAELINLAENPKYSELKQTMALELERLKKETDYHDIIPRPDPEPVLNVKTGKVISVNFKKLDFSQKSKNGIILNGIKKNTENGVISGSFSKGTSITIDNTPDLDPSLGTFIIECVVKPDSPDGVIASSGSQQDGWILFVENGIPGFVVCHDRHLQFVDGISKITGRWSHLVAVIVNYTNIMQLYADGKLLESRQILLPIRTIKNKQGDIVLGEDSRDLVDPQEISKLKFTGDIQLVNIYREKMSDTKLKQLSSFN